MAKEDKEKKYDASSITVLEGLEAVRKRPGMYIGTTGYDGLHTLVREIFDNSRDEAMNGRCSRIEIVLMPGGYVRITDDGRGIPVDIHPKTKISALETVMTVLHAGGKFGDGGYTVSGGLHGVGASVVNALSIHTKVEVHKEGKKHVQEYVIGKPKAKVKEIGKTKYQGTVVTFKPDAEIFKEGVIFDYNWIVNHVRQQAYLVKGLRITVIDAREAQDNLVDKLREDAYFFADTELDAPSKTFYFEGGLKSLVIFYNSQQKTVHDSVFYIEKKVEGVESVEIALQYVDDISARIIGFANNIYNPEGGTHLTGFRTALTRTINSYGRKAGLIKEADENFTGDDVIEGLTAVVSVKLREIQFEGQTKAKLGSTEAQSAVATVFGEAFASFLEEHPDEARSIVNKAVLALRARKAAKAAKDSVLRKGALEGMTLPGKLADCQSKSAEESELFIVEGDSAGGTAKTGRDRRIQAILPLRGKILNVERARLDKMLGSEQVKNLVIALGTAIGDTFDIGKLRYHKVIIATDADVDGAHIRTLILTLFYRYFPALLEGGFVYIAQSPLYKIKKGKDVTYLYSDQEKNVFAKNAGGEDKVGDIQRYKGLGEMNAEELWDTTMDPARRVLKQVKVDDAAEANIVFDMLMGTDVPARKSFIQSNAKMAHLDI